MTCYNFPDKVTFYFARGRLNIKKIIEQCLGTMVYIVEGGGDIFTQFYQQAWCYKEGQDLASWTSSLPSWAK